MLFNNKSLTFAFLANAIAILTETANYYPILQQTNILFDYRFILKIKKQ